MFDRDKLTKKATADQKVFASHRLRRSGITGHDLQQICLAIANHGTHIKEVGDCLELIKDGIMCTLLETEGRYTLNLDPHGEQKMCRTTIAIEKPGSPFSFIIDTKLMGHPLARWCRGLN